MSRSRFSIRLQPDEPAPGPGPEPSGARILVRQRVAVVLLFGVFMGLLALPDHRRSLLDQAATVLRSRQTPDGPLEPFTHSAHRLRREAEGRPGDRDLQFSLALLGALGPPSLVA